MRDTLIILDYGSQYTQLIARRLRELQVFCEIFHWEIPAEQILQLKPKGFILSGGPSSVYKRDAPDLPSNILDSRVPVLGICYGMQLLAQKLGGKVSTAEKREYGSARIRITSPNALFQSDSYTVWMSHGDRVEELPPGFISTASSESCPSAAIADPRRQYYGLQFHPEVHHTLAGKDMLKNFALGICRVSPHWTPGSIIEESIQTIRTKLRDRHVLIAVSGGVDSSVAAALIHQAVGDQLTALFVDNGLLRAGERETVISAMRQQLGDSFHFMDASSIFMDKLHGVSDPEKKRMIIGETFIRVFEKKARELGKMDYLAQGTIYPDVIESRAPERAAAHKIKSHHNVGGLPGKMRLQLIEPLRYLFKDEVRAIGTLLGLPDELVWRQPFPGPGLAVRCLGEVNSERLEKLRAADAIFTSELRKASLIEQPNPPVDAIAQAFAALLPVRSVGVMGDQRTYQETIVLRAVSSQDFMTADWVPIPHDLLALVAGRIVNEVPGVNRVVYDLTSKPPATIEWE